MLSQFKKQIKLLSDASHFLLTSFKVMVVLFQALLNWYGGVVTNDELESMTMKAKTTPEPCCLSASVLAFLMEMPTVWV